MQHNIGYNNMVQKIKHMASVSGGKCSTAMVIRMLEENMRIDEMVFFNSGWEFPIMIKQVKKLAKYTGLKLTILKPDPTFEEILYQIPVARKRGPDKGEVYRHGHGWPVHNRRWNDREMVNVLNRHCKHSIHYIGYPFERKDKAKMKDRSRSPLLDNEFDTKKTFEEVTDLSKKKNTRYPLVEWCMDGADCLKFCKRHGFEYGDFYKGRDRAGMFCCPLQSMGSIKLLREQFPELWRYMLEVDKKIEPNFGFNHGKTVNELEVRFKAEEEKKRKVMEDGLL